MSKVPDIMPVTDLRQDAAAAIKRVRTSGKPLVITQRGRAAASCWASRLTSASSMSGWF